MLVAVYTARRHPRRSVPTSGNSSMARKKSAVPKTKDTTTTRPARRSPASRGPAAGAPPASYAALLHELKGRIRTAQVKAALAVNRELIGLYWDIGRAIVERQKAEGWGQAIIDRLSSRPELLSTFWAELPAVRLESALDRGS